MKIPLSIRRAVHIAFLMMAILLGAFAALRIHKIPLVEIPFPDNYPLEIENLKHGFEQGDTPSNRDYESLFHYFLEGYLYPESASSSARRSPAALAAQFLKTSRTPSATQSGFFGCDNAV